MCLSPLVQFTEPKHWSRPHVIGSQASLRVPRQIKWQTPPTYHNPLTHWVDVLLTLLRKPESHTLHISSLLPPSAVCVCELQEPATGHRYFHAHRHGDLHPDQRGVLHHPPHECNLRQWCCSCGKCIWSALNRLTLDLHSSSGGSRPFQMGGPGSGHIQFSGYQIY